MLEGRKTKILRQAIELFAERGYTETTMRDLANACGIQASSLYNYFRSKQQILQEIMALYTENTERAVDAGALEAMAREGNARAVLEALFFTFPADDAQQLKLILKIFLQEQYRNEAVGRYMREVYIEGTRAAMRQALDFLVREGALPPVDTAVYANLFSALNIAATMESGFHGAGEIGQEENLHWEHSLRFLIEQLLAQSTPGVPGN